MSKDKIEIQRISAVGWLMGLVYFLFLQFTMRYEPLLEWLGDSVPLFYFATTVVFILAIVIGGRKKDVFVINP